MLQAPAISAAQTLPAMSAILALAPPSGWKVSRKPVFFVDLEQPRRQLRGRHPIRPTGQPAAESVLNHAKWAGRPTGQ
jgi:hypothetical protein